jgi:hypothetical protein
MKTYPTLLSIILLFLHGSVLAQEINVGVDIYNRYVWRGIDYTNAPSIQPSLSIDIGSLEFGIFGAYPLSNQETVWDEMDVWISYELNLSDALGINLSLNDCFFPDAGIKLFNFNNYDVVNADGSPNPGAHTLEAGIVLTGPESFPLSLSGYMNIYNDAGYNSYFQLDYPFAINNVELNLSLGATPGSKDNLDYYGSENFAVINAAISTCKELTITDTFTIPILISVIVNPRDEISYFVVGLSL